MQTTFKKSTMVVLTLVVAVMFSSFATGGRGGDGFEIYAGRQLLHQQYPASKPEVKTIELPASLAGQQLYVRFSHCGQPGTGRKLIVKTAAQNVLRQFTYADAASGSNGFMSCAITEILALQKTNGSSIQLYYTCRQPGKEQLLAILKTPAVTAP